MTFAFSFPLGAVVDGDGIPTPAFAQWTTRMNSIGNAAGQSGATANRPTKGLWVGRMYFDTTLAKPIWYDANGATGWCDATGADV